MLRIAMILGLGLTFCGPIRAPDAPLDPLFLHHLRAVRPTTPPRWAEPVRPAFDQADAERWLEELIPLLEQAAARRFDRKPVVRPGVLLELTDAHLGLTETRFAQLTRLFLERYDEVAARR